MRSASGRPIDVDRLAAASSDGQADSKLTFYAPEDEDIDGIVLNKVNTQAETVPEPRSPQSHTAPQAQVVAAPEHKASRLFTKNSKNAKGYCKTVIFIIFSIAFFYLVVLLRAIKIHRRHRRLLNQPPRHQPLPNRHLHHRRQHLQVVSFDQDL